MADKLRASEIIQDGYVYISRAEANRQMVAMLSDIQLEFEELQGKYSPNYDEASQHLCEIIQEKINGLRGN